MPETQVDDNQHSDLGQGPGKRKTTYPRDHPTNPKPPKRSKAEIQKAAKEKKEAQLAQKEAVAVEKQHKLLKAEEKRKLSAQRIAAVEDTVERSEKERQLRSERPDIRTMETYREQLQKKKENETVVPSVGQDDLINQSGDDDNMYLDPHNLPPDSIVDTDSDGARMGLTDIESGDDDAYIPPSDEDKDGEHGKEGNDSDASIAQLRTQLKEKKTKKKKVSTTLLLKCKLTIMIV